MSGSTHRAFDATWDCVPLLRVVVLVVVWIVAAYLLNVGNDLPTVVMAISALGTAAAVMARQILPSRRRA